MSVAAGQDTIAAAFATSGKRAALMPYLMGGFPTVDASRAVGEACANNDDDQCRDAADRGGDFA